MAQLVPGLERSPEDGKGYLLRYPDLENFMDWIVHGVAKGWTQLSDFCFSLYSHYSCRDAVVIHDCLTKCHKT